MRIEINIDYPMEKMEQSRKRLEAREKFRYVDRVPVQYCVVARYFAPLFNLRYIDFFKDAETQYYWRLQFAKYRIENIPEDFCTGPAITVGPYFDNIMDSAAFGAEAVWPENETLRRLISWRTPAAGSRSWMILCRPIPDPSKSRHSNWS